MSMTFEIPLQGRDDRSAHKPQAFAEGLALQMAEDSV